MPQRPPTTVVDKELRLGAAPLVRMCPLEAVTAAYGTPVTATQRYSRSLWGGPWPVVPVPPVGRNVVV